LHDYNTAPFSRHPIPLNTETINELIQLLDLEEIEKTDEFVDGFGIQGLRLTGEEGFEGAVL
jgi:molybdenum cofactor biosynthesis enzyme MoaA